MTAAASAGSYFALPVYRRLTLAWLDRMANSDTVRAAIVLQKVSSVWPDLRQDFAREVGERRTGGVPSGTTYPTSIAPDFGSSDTQNIMVLSVMIEAPAGGALNTAAAGLYESPFEQWPNLARNVLSAVPASAAVRSYIAPVASASPSSLSGVLDGLIAGTVAAGASSSRDPQPSPSPPTPHGGGGGIVMPDTQITGQAPKTTIPAWGWWVLGGVVVVGAGGFVYVKWFAPKKTASA